MTSPTHFLGIMSGSSLDGLDIALCKFNGLDRNKLSFSVEKAVSVSFPTELYERLKSSTSLSTSDLFKLEVSFSKFCAKSVYEHMISSSLKIDYIAFHGHTIFHFPEDGFTTQIGNGSIIAAETGIPCITDFRAKDIALGGQGAPLAPIVEHYLYPGYDLYFNVGGIANLSLHKEDCILSFDSCPCNQVLNYLSTQIGLPYDDKGSLARKGTISRALIMKWDQLDYFARPTPKSMDNSWVKEIFIEVMDKTEISREDKLATMTEFIAMRLTCDVRALIPESQRLISGFITGGGTYNEYLVERIREHMKTIPLRLVIPDEDTINFKEAILMALMGYLRVNKIQNTIPSVTGASQPTIGGAIYL